MIPAGSYLGFGLKSLRRKRFIVGPFRGDCVRGGWLLGRRLPSLLRIAVVRIVGISSTRSGCRFCRLVGRSIFFWFVSTWLSRFVLPCVAGGSSVSFGPGEAEFAVVGAAGVAGVEVVVA